jgi:3-methylornithine--L-lysine ligase
LKVAIAGGKLQGVEASFLAHELGWETVLLDRDPNVPARGLCDSFFQCDLLKNVFEVHRIVKKVDMVIPALENVSALRFLGRCAASAGIPFAYDEKAHFVSRSKKRSNRFFEKLGISTPRPWPQCGLPVIVKPSNLSGSEGVSKLSTEEELSAFFSRIEGGQQRWVIQEYLEGPSYSLEVVGFEDQYEILQVTDLEMDDRYDCKRVLAPSGISGPLEEEFRKITHTIAKGLGLKGIMDIEVIDHYGELKVLEIDARLPSQTPITVLKSAGINMLEIFGDIFVDGSLRRRPGLESPRGVIYEQIRVSQKGIEVLGEHIMGDAGPLRSVDKFFGTDVALTNFDGSRLPWVGTLVVTGEGREEAWKKRCQVIEEIEKDLSRFVSSRPKEGSDFSSPA